MQLPDFVRTILTRDHAWRRNERKGINGRYSLSERLALLMLIDGVLILLVLCGIAIFVPHLSSDKTPDFRTGFYWNWVPLFAGSWLLFASLHDLYDLSVLHRRIQTAVRVALATLTVAAACYLISLVISISWALEITIAFLSVALPLLILWRLAYISVSSMPRFSRRAVIIGDGERAHRAAELVGQHSFLNYQVLGYLSEGQNDGQDAPRTMLDGTPAPASPFELSTWMLDARVHEIIIATERPLDRDLSLALIECQAQGAQILWLPDLYERFRYNVPVDQIDPLWVLQAVQRGPNIAQRIAKRALDLTVVFFALPTLMLFIPLVALAIKLDSPGPVFYRQLRCGRGGKPFLIYKFRTMYVDAERDGKARWATKNDPRITRVGRILRKTRLDELPQILNILQGEMSIVGPRPERPEFVEELKASIPYYHTRLLFKPGLTGWAQVQFEYTSTVEDTITKLQYDIYYIHRWSLWLDIYIMFRTIGVVLGLKGT